jgi:upstream-binding transcription factor
MSVIENLSEIIKREVLATLERLNKGIFSAVKEDHPEVDGEEYDLQLEKFAKNTVKKIFATKEFKNIEKKMTKTKKEKRDPQAPKAAKNSFIFFCAEKRDEVKKEESDLKPTEITKKLGEMWREMDDEDKEEYQQKAVGDKERFENEMEDYEPQDGFRCPKKSPKKSTSPKRARSAYIFFCGEKRAEVTDDLVRRGKKKTEVLTVLGKMWRELDDEDKKPFDKMAKKDKKRYENEMKTFKPESEDEDSDEDEDKPKEKKSKKTKKSEDSDDEDEEKPKEKKSKKTKKSEDSDDEDEEKPKEKKSKKSKKEKKPKKSSDSDDDDEALLSE